MTTREYVVVDDINFVTDELQKLSMFEQLELNHASTRRDSEKLSLESGYDFTLRILNWNVHGDTKKGFADHRKKLLLEFFRSTMPDVLLIQECQWKDFTRHVNTTVPDRHYHYQGSTREAGISWDNNILECIQLKVIEDAIPAETRVEIGWRRAFTQRSVFYQMEHRTHAIKFVLCSFHGLYTGLDIPTRQKSCLWFLNTYVKAIQDYLQLPIFVGGDFNCDISTLDIPGWIIPSYKNTNRRKDMVDWLCFRSCIEHGIIGKFAEVEAQDIDIHGQNYTQQRSMELSANAPSQKYLDALDHDPLSAKIMVKRIQPNNTND